MASNLFSRFAGGRSFYEELHRRHADDLDEEERLGLDVDEENINQQFADYDIDNTPGLADSRPTVQSHREPSTATAVQTWHEDDGDNDVPESLLLEADRQPQPSMVRTSRTNRRAPSSHPIETPIPGPSNKKARAQWETTKAHQRLHRDETISSAGLPPEPVRAQRPPTCGIPGGSVRERTLWKWANVTNMDSFLHDVYSYYRQGGIWCILLARILGIIQAIFTATLLTFLTQCVDYDKIPGSQRLSEIVVPQCTRKMPMWWNLLLWMWAMFVVFRCLNHIADMRSLLWMRDFYTYLLEIPDSDMQTISWQDIVARFMALRDANPSVATNLSAHNRKYLNRAKERVDAHDIANRLMRKDNYVIAMFNKDLLDLSLPIPFLGSYQFWSESMAFWLWLSVIDYVFDPRGELRQEFLKADRRGQLSQKLRERFKFYAFLSFVAAPGYFFYNFVVHLFMNLDEYKRNTASVFSERAYTPFAMWKFREFNELEHIFRDRVNMSYPFAQRYIDQFPKVKTEHIARTVVFISGAVLAVLAVATTLDSDMFVLLEVTPGRTALFYMTIFGSIFAAARGMISEDSKVFDPDFAMTQVIEYTHYEPDHWKGRLHSFDVKKDFSELYKSRFVIFLEELLGIIVTPIILGYTLPKCSDRIVDFFREFTIHVDGVGYVCTFAEFNFKMGVPNDKKPGASATGVQGDVRDDYYSTKYGKMAASYYNFIDNYVINPKSGIPSHPKHQFYPPPTFPGLQSPTLAADMQASRAGRSERARSRGPVPGRTPRFGATIAPSPMASMLLDPHHQPIHGIHGRSIQYTRGARSGYVGNDILEEPEDALDQSTAIHGREGGEENMADLGGSMWETSPMKGLSRENSDAPSEEEDGPGVFGLVRQLKQAQKEQEHRH